MILDTVDVKKKGVHTRYLISVSYTHLTLPTKLEV